MITRELLSRAVGLFKSLVGYEQVAHSLRRGFFWGKGD
jgi:hypothetical protein